MYIRTYIRTHLRDKGTLTSPGESMLMPALFCTSLNWNTYRITKWKALYTIVTILIPNFNLEAGRCRAHKSRKMRRATRYRKAVTEGTTEAHRARRTRYRISIEYRMELGTWMKGWNWECLMEGVVEDAEAEVWCLTTSSPPCASSLSSVPFLGSMYVSVEGCFGCFLMQWTDRDEMTRESSAIANTPTSMAR